MRRGKYLGARLLLSLTALTILAIGLNSLSCAKKTEEYEPPGSVAQQAPVVQTKAASDVTTSTAALNGFCVSAGSAAVVSVSFEYGLDLGYGKTASNSGMAAKNQSFRVSVSGLAPNTTYHFRAVANYPGGSTYGADMTFTTSAVPPGV